MKGEREGGGVVQCFEKNLEAFNLPEKNICYKNLNFDLILRFCYCH